ncbi:hypothetical protein DFH08DRAFT_972731 [Mycena albidolilacea]|uniref:Uncharacterized protein n=1 Tax=Mycena albidolilacea TaxID=1033008 RepID=A0AAD6ZAN3_9AGAR|nr:hypothetical protein DFH08DRAFT_972731 [Mycena albidolilacea]
MLSTRSTWGGLLRRARGMMLVAPVVCPSTPFTPPLASVSQAPFARPAANAAPVRARNPTLPRKHARKHEAASAPPMPTGSNSKPLYVYSRDNGTTIYANEQQASSAARRGLIDGSFRKVEITPHLSEAFAYGTESALPVIDISDTESVQVINISDTESV